MSKKTTKAFNTFLSLMMAFMLIVSFVPMQVLSVWAAETTTAAEDTIEVTVHVSNGTDDLANAEVTLGDETDHTNATGIAVLNVAVGSYTLYVKMEGYDDYSEEVEVSQDKASFEAILSEKTSEPSIIGTYTFSIKNDDVSPSDVTVTLDGSELTEKDGVYSVNFYDNDDHDLVIAPSEKLAVKYQTLEETVSTADIAGEAGEYTLKLRMYTITVSGAEEKTFELEYGATFEYKVDEAQVKEGYELIYVTYNGNKEKAELGKVISFTVTENAAVTFAYANMVTFTFDSDKGSINVGGKNISENTLELNEGYEPEYSISPKPGYRISSIKINGEEKAVTETEGTLSASVSTIEVTFEEITYAVTVVINNSDGKNGAATVSNGDKLVLEAGTASVSKKYTVGVNDLNSDTNEYTLKLRVDSIAENYNLRYNGNICKAGADIEIKGIKGDKTVTLSVSPIDYDITYYDPFADVSVTEKGNVESGEIILKTPDTVQNGYTFIGWSETAPDSLKSDSKGVITKYADGIDEKKDLYAVYTLNCISVDAESKAVYGATINASYTPETDGDKISSEWFSGDVKLTVNSLDGAKVLLSVGGKNLEAGEDNIYTVIANSQDNNGVQKIEVSQKINIEKHNAKFVYVSEKADSFDIRFDKTSPTIAVNSKTSSSKDDSKDVADTVTVSDSGSGIAKIQYAAINIADDSDYAELFTEKEADDKDVAKAYEELVKKVKEQLRDEMWIDLGDKVSEEETSENSIERIYNYSYDENTYVVYRAVDAAGNDVYSSFDHTIPEISKVTVEYNDAKGNQSVQSGSIYTNGDITVKMTVKDKRLAVVKEGYTYSSAELKVYDKINNDELYSAPISNSQEKFSVFYDKWDVEFVIPVSKAELLDKPLFFVITAQDQVGNEAPDYSYSGEIVICTEEPEITVTYDYTDGAGAQSTDNDTVYSKSEITAHITVSAEYFGDNGKASVKVTDSDGQQYNVTFNKSAEEWTGDLVIGENGDVNDLTLTIEATSQAGVTNTYTSPKLYVDKTAPEISVTYSYNTRNNEVLLNANGEAEIINSESAVNPTDNIYNNGNEAAIQANITVSDDNLYPFGADSATSCVVKVNGTPCEVTWTKADGSWTAKINLPCDSETAEQISLDIEAADQAGNKKSYSFDGLYNDYAAPEISAVKLALEEESGFIKAVHTLLENTLGVHFSVQVNVTVEMSDDCSGENALALYYESLVNNSDSETVLKQIEQKTGSESGGKKCYYITLPEVTDEEPLAYWEKNIRFAVSDNVGNTSLFDLSDLDEKDLVDYGDTAILYETTAPEITISENDADNNSIFYTDNNLRWILNNKSILITVSDETAEGLDSGIYSIRVDNKVNGKENKDVYTFIGTDLNKKTLTSSIEFEYKELGAGKNEITVYVEDISGNTNSQSITVYKDETEPVVAKIDLSAEEGTYSVLNHGNYFSSDAVLTVDVLDAQYTSGIASVKAFYIAGEKRTELVQRETQSPASGSLESGNNETTRIFDIEYLNDTEGYIEIVITDNVGNEQTFTKDSAIPENSAVKVNSLIFEKTPAEISAGIVAGDNTVKYEQSETKVFYSNSDIVFNILIDDTVGENAKQVSGIASYEIALNGKTLEKLTADTSKEYSDKTANISYSFNAGEQGVAQEGLNTVTVKVTDNAGNENSEVYEFYIDTNEPVITSIGLSKKDLSAVEKVLRTLTFGNFFNDTVVLTVGVKDADAAEVVSGMKSVTLIMSDAEGNEQEKIENTDYTKLGDGSLSYTFELPDSDKELSAWTSILSISASDNVDNATEVQSISSFGDGVETNFTNSLVLYEKEPPKVETSINNGENGAANEDVLFVDNSNKTYWMRENQNFEIAVTDKLLGEGLNSGLYSVSITNKGVSVYDIVYVDENTTEALSDASYIIEYGKFEAGRNTVVVTAVDNAGNKTVEEYLVYKDETAPVVADIKLSGEAGKYNILTHGNYFSVDAVLTVDILDAQYTSGIASVEAFYVAGKKRTELVQRETQALASDSLENGYNETTRVFDIPYDENAEGYIEIIIKDNVGNESIFTADSQLPENFSIKVNSLMFERSQSAIGRTEKTSKPGYTASDSKEFYINDDIEYEIEINDTNDKISGISTVKITLNNTEVLYKDERNTKEGIKSYSFNVKDVIKAAGAGAALEGINVIKIESTDNAGNYNEKEFVFYIDTKAPVVQSIVMSLEKPDVAGKALNILPFGNFFNDTVILTVGIKDDDEITSAVSGMKSLTLHYVDNATENKEVKTAVNTDGKTEDGITYYSFKLPVPSKAEAEKALNYWLSDLSLSATDNVGNVMDTTAINEFGESVANFENSAVLFETSAPTIKSSYDTKDTNVLYMEKNSSWVRDGKSFVITVEDSSLAAGLNSGLNSVRVKRNSVSMSEYNYSVAGATEPVFTHTINFAYSDLVEGENIITVDFVDNAGNQASKTYVVYKDVDIPQITKIEFAGEKGSNLSYGNFYSENMTVTLNLLDTEYSSGIKSVTVNYITENGTVIALTEQKPSNPETNALTSGENSIVRVFDLAANNTTGYLEIVVTDNVGNSFTFGKDSEIPSGSNIKNTFLMMEKTVPVITETIAQSAYVCDENSEDKKLCEKNWYNTFDIPISIDVDDGGSTVSGIRRITTTLNDVTVSEATSDESNELTSSASYSFNIQDIKDSDGVAAAKQGENIVTVTLTDNAGNSVTETYYIYVDVTAPVVESFNFVGKNGGEDADGRCNTVSVTDYGYYFSDDTTVTVNVADALPSSGVANIHFVAVPVDSSLSNILYESDEAATYCALAIEGTEKNSSSASFVVKAGFKGQIYAYVTDNVGNDSVENAEDISSWARPDGVILETQQQHDSREQHTSIMLGSENYVRDLANKTPLYNGNVTVSVAVSDEYAGIRDIELTVTAPYDTANNAQYPVSFNNKGSYANKNDKFIYSVGDEVSGWNISATDLNLVTKVNRVITVTNNSNDIVIYIKMTDNSGNITEQKVELNIDKDAPIINVSFAPASESDDEVYTGYFNQDRIMTVTVIERNFDPSLVTLTATKNGEIYAIGTIFGSAVQYDADAQRGIESYEYTLTHTFHEDGDYTFAISAIDLADNSTEDEAVNYGSEADRTVAKVFTVDETAPEIFIDISGEKGRDEYYKGNVTLTVAINEHNFAQTEGPFERHSITIAVMDSQSGNVVTATLPSADYSEAGDIRTFVYEFSDEFRYQVTGIIVTDMAGNQTDAYSGSYNGGDFVVDQTAPEISFFKQDMTTPLNKTASHEEDFAPVVRFLDTNLAAGDSSTYSISLTGNYNKEGLAGTSNYVYSAIPNADNPGELIIRFSSLPVEEDIDDIYTLSVTVVDKAGYETTGSAMFSVNRFGSTFMVSPETKQLIDKFYTNTEQDVKIIQINSAEVTDQSITLTRNNNINNDLVEGRDYTIKADIPDSNNMTDSSWYEYDYTINAANFVQEGIYSATVYSSDSADNTITSVTSKRTINLFKDIERADKALLTSDSGLEANVNFRMDKTKPFAFASDLDKSQYFSGSHAFTIHATDDVKLASVTLTIDGVEKAVYDASEIENGKEYVLTNDTNEMQEIVISAVDMAGNVYMPSEDEILHVQVTRNLFKWYQNNTIAQIISIVILVAVVILLIILIKRRKNKSEEA